MDPFSEVLAGLKYDYTVDWWSLGILIYDMLTGSVSRVEERGISMMLMTPVTLM